MNIKRKHLNLLYPYSYKKKQIEQISSIKANEKMQASTQEQFVGSASVSGLNKKKTRFTLEKRVYLGIRIICPSGETCVPRN